jgi:hypothetical protein
MSTVRYTSEELDNMPSRTDWARVRSMSDSDIDFSELPELHESFWKNAHHPEQLVKTA